MRFKILYSAFHTSRSQSSLQQQQKTHNAQNLKHKLNLKKQAPETQQMAPVCIPVGGSSTELGPQYRTTSN